MTRESALGFGSLQHWVQHDLHHQISLCLVSYVKAVLEKHCFPGKVFNVQLYGSLQHGLFIPGSSKINIDISPEDELNWPADNAYNGMVLRMLVSWLQSSSEKRGVIQHPVLVWHRTVQRPWIVLLAWDGIPVQVTYHNVAGLRVSQLMTQTLHEFPFLRLTLLYWKEQLRKRRDVQYMGPNTGQISTYALFTVLCSHLKILMASTDLASFEQRARQVAVSHLLVISRSGETVDPIMAVNLTSRSFLAEGMAHALAGLPAITA